MTGRRDQGSATIATTIGGATAAVIALPLLALTSVSSPNTISPCASSPPPSNAAYGIPANYLTHYQAAGQAYGISWAVLAAIGKLESDHGRGTGPGIHSGHNSAGAMGPMQFLADTWRQYGVDGNHDGHRNVYDPADAIPSAANYLRHSGAPDNLTSALFEYNHSLDYVRLVLQTARTYTTNNSHPPNSLTNTALSNCETSHSNSPRAKSSAASRIISYARAQLGKPYVWGAAGPSAFDCSGLTQRAYQAAGIIIPRTTYEQWHAGTRVTAAQAAPGDLIFMRMEARGPGHVGIVIGNGQMIAAPHTGTVVQTQTYTHRTDIVGFVHIPG